MIVYHTSSCPIHITWIFIHSTRVAYCSIHTWPTTYRIYNTTSSSGSQHILNIEGVHDFIELLVAQFVWNIYNIVWDLRGNPRATLWLNSICFIMIASRWSAVHRTIQINKGAVETKAIFSFSRTLQSCWICIIMSTTILLHWPVCVAI